MDMRIVRTSQPRPRPNEAELGFGRYFTDHLFAMTYKEGRGWHDARVVPYGPIPTDPAAGVFHYGQAMFEGTKAFRGPDGVVRLFRPQANAERMSTGAPRLCMPCPSNQEQLEGMLALVKADVDWVPRLEGTSLYLRPTLIATEGFLGVRPATEYLYFVIASPVGSYYAGGTLKPVRIFVETVEVRAPRGGLGAVKAGANYAASLHAAQQAKQRGFDQVLWLDSQSHELVEEVGTMNIMAVVDGALVTPPLSDSILPGVTRDSVLTLARDMGWKVEERNLSVKELRAAQQRGQLQEMFGTGTAAVISPVGELAFDSGEPLIINGGQVGPLSLRLFETISDIQRGRTADVHRWTLRLD